MVDYIERRKVFDWSIKCIYTMLKIKRKRGKVLITIEKQQPLLLPPPSCFLFLFFFSLSLVILVSSAAETKLNKKCLESSFKKKNRSAFLALARLFLSYVSCLSRDTHSPPSSVNMLALMSCLCHVELKSLKSLESNRKQRPTK